MLFAARDYMERKEAAGGDIAKSPKFDMKLEALGGHNVPHLVVVLPFIAHAVVVQAKVAVGIDKAGIDPQAGGIENFLAGVRIPSAATGIRGIPPG